MFDTNSVCDNVVFYNYTTIFLANDFKKNIKSVKKIFSNPRKKPVSKFKNFLIIAHWLCYIEHIDETSFNANVTWVPLDKKKHRLEKNKSFENGWASFEKKLIAEKNQSKIQLGMIFDWYIGYEIKKYHPKKQASSRIVFMRKYGKTGKRVNMKDVERRVEELFTSLNWRN